MGQRVVRVLLAALGVLLISTGSLIGQNAGDAPLTLPLQFAGTAFGQAGAAAGKSFGFTVFIDQWTTDEQAKAFLDTLRENGPDALVTAFDKTKMSGACHRRALWGILFALPGTRLRRVAECTS